MNGSRLAANAGEQMKRRSAAHEAVEDVMNQAERMGFPVKRITLGFYQNKDSGEHVHASGTVAVRLFATKAVNPMPIEDKFA
jgi:hypothetical protein